MTEITVVRRGLVSYLAGYERNRSRVGNSPVYGTARVEQLSDGSALYYPPTAAARTTDGGVSLPAELLPEVRWEQ